MEDGASGGADQPVDGGPWPTSSPVDPGGRAPDPLAAEAAELRRLVDAGAGTPEELRALAARLREHRQREEAVWRSAVKPHLVKQGRGRLRRQPPASPPPPLPEIGQPIPPPPGLAAEGSPDPALAPVPPAPGLPPTWLAAAPPPGAGGAVASGSRALWLGLGLLAMVGLAVLAARTTVWVLLLPLLALLGWAWVQGRDAAP